MLLEIKLSRDAFNFDNGVSESTLLALENIGASVREGRHYLIADRDVLGAFGGIVGLSQPVASTYNRLVAQMTQWHSLLSCVRRKVVINSIEGEVSNSRDGDCSIINVPLNWFSSHRHVGPPFLLAENIVDAKLLKLLAEEISCDGVVCPRSISVDLLHGGGDTTADMLVELSTQEGRIGFCVVDSDRKRPGGAKGGTAKKVIALGRDLKLIEIKVLDERELENCIPWHVTKRICGQELDEAGWKLMDDLASTPRYLFADIKSGLKLRSLLVGAEEDLSYWSDLRKPEIHCVDECKNRISKNCECLIVPAVAGNLLTKLLQLDRGEWSKLSLSDFSEGLADSINIVMSLGLGPNSRKV